VELEKARIVEFFVVRGDMERAQQADEALPDLVDLREHAPLLGALGIDAGLLATQIDNLEA
jgi:hypothetical protein